MNNPYAPPSSDAPPIIKAKFYSAGQIAWAGFLGSPIAGFILIAINYRRWNKHKEANIAIGVGLLLTVVLLAISAFLPENFPNSVIPLAYTVGIYQGVRVLQGPAYDKHFWNGGAKASTWGATGVGILCGFVILALLFGVILAMPDEWLAE